MAHCINPRLFITPLLLALGLSILSGCSTAQDTSGPWDQHYTDDQRLEYYGYVFLGDATEARSQADLKRLSEYSNLIGYVSEEKSMRGKYPFSDLEDADALIEAHLKKEGEAIRHLDSLGFTIAWPVPLADLIDDMDLEGFRRELKRIKKYMPEMELVDWVYILDEPNFRKVPVETLEEFIDVFKSEFPKPKVMFFYAIVHPQFLDTVPPRNADILGIDPYMFTSGYEHNAKDFEYYYRESLACSLRWINRWDKPFILGADCFYSRDPKGKRMPIPETGLWNYIVAMTQPRCVGLIWFYYGNEPIESENLKGMNFTESSEELIKMHREIGETILGKPTPLGLQWDSFGPAE